jgi:hypothetical protein
MQRPFTGPLSFKGHCMKKTDQKSALPLFLKSPVMLDAKRHASAAIRAGGSYLFARDTNSVPLNASEFGMASRHYPIVFTDEESPTPVAIVGLEKRNYFVNDKGDWKADTYIPAYVRKYPFAFTEIRDAKELALCVDEEAAQFMATAKGKNVAKLYDGKKPTAFTTNALEFCTAFHNHFQLTKQLGIMLKKAGLLIPHQSDAVLKTGRSIRLGGFQMIDQKALNALPDGKFLELRKEGWLPVVYFAMQSMVNWRPLVDMAVAYEKPARKSTKAG